jgi:hypothetical protein
MEKIEPPSKVRQKAIRFVAAQNQSEPYLSILSRIGFSLASRDSSSCLTFEGGSMSQL